MKDWLKRPSVIIILSGIVFAILVCIFFGEPKKSSTSSATSTSSGSSYKSNSGSSYSAGATTSNDTDTNEEVNDWMKEQAKDKDYSSDDGGDYYCMGKNNTCPNKTHNKYDLYCSSCDPDGDNKEG